MKIDTKDLDLAITLKVNPTTAYCLLKNFVDLKPNDTIILSGANSFCGKMLLQFAKVMKVNAVGIVRDRPGFDSLAQSLKELGAAAILRPEELKDFDFLKQLNATKPPVLGLDCVAGELATEMIKKLSPSAVYVNYGAMSYKPVLVPVGCLIFKDIKVRGFWLSNPSSGISQDMLNDVKNIIVDNKLFVPKPVYVNIPNSPQGKLIITDIIKECMMGKSDKKYVLTFNDDPSAKSFKSETKY